METYPKAHFCHFLLQLLISWQTLLEKNLALVHFLFQIYDYRVYYSCWPCCWVILEGLQRSRRKMSFRVSNVIFMIMLFCGWEVFSWLDGRVGTCWWWFFDWLVPFWGRNHWVVYFYWFWWGWLWLWVRWSDDDFRVCEWSVRLVAGTKRIAS